MVFISQVLLSRFDVCETAKELINFVFVLIIMSRVNPIGEK